MNVPAQPVSLRRVKVLLDAFFLACSWTWCIGMFLPILLLRDYGWWGFIVFAFPNVVGAAAMGFVLRPGASESIVARHRPMCEAFSLATIAFQVYFMLAIVVREPLTGHWAGMVPALAGIVAIVALRLRAGPGARGNLGPAAFFTFVASLWAGVMFVFLDVPAQVQAAVANVPAPGAMEILPLAPVCLFGFALCPYLDLTFLRVRRGQTEAGARQAFALGFGVLFLAMILMTCVYAPVFLAPPASANLVLLLVAIGVHLGVQLGFTIHVHTLEVARPLSARAATWVGLGAVILLMLLGSRLAMHGLSGFEVIYRVFMALYGLVFPAYVWLLMIPTRDGHSGMTGRTGRVKLRVFAVAVGLALPMFAMGLIVRQEVWLFPGLGIVLLARLFLPRGPRAGRPA